MLSRESLLTGGLINSYSSLITTGMAYLSSEFNQRNTTFSTINNLSTISGAVIEICTVLLQKHDSMTMYFIEIVKKHGNH